jgi:hypothetical protein
MASERETLLLGVLNQLDLSGKIDYKRLAHNIGIQSSEAARMRWQRFRNNLRASTGTSSAKPLGVQKSTKSPPKKVKWARKETSEEASRADDELDDMEETPETPVRKMPSRKARVVVFKDELSDFEDAEEEKRCDEVMKLMEGVEEGSSSSDHSSGI